MIQSEGSKIVLIINIIYWQWICKTRTHKRCWDLKFGEMLRMRPAEMEQKLLRQRLAKHWIRTLHPLRLGQLQAQQINSLSCILSILSLCINLQVFTIMTLRNAIDYVFSTFNNKEYRRVYRREYRTECRTEYEMEYVTKYAMEHIMEYPMEHIMEYAMEYVKAYGGKYRIRNKIWNRLWDRMLNKLWNGIGKQVRHRI